MENGTTARNLPRADYISRISEAGTAAFRLYGPSKTNVADIARLLGKSPASVYKIFSKAAMWDAIAGNFFESVLCFTASDDAGLVSAADRLKETALGQHQLMLEARHGDCQMFNLILLAANGQWQSFGYYLKRLQARVEEPIRAGVRTNEFAAQDVEAASSCFCALMAVLWDPRLVTTLPSRQLEISAQKLVSFAVAALRRIDTT